MDLENLELGDVVYAASTLFNDGSMPGSEEGEVLVQQGSRGVIVMKGHIEASPNQSVFLVRFEDQDLNLGPPVGCWSEDLSVDPNGEEA